MSGLSGAIEIEVNMFAAVLKCIISQDSVLVFDACFAHGLRSI